MWPGGRCAQAGMEDEGGAGAGGLGPRHLGRHLRIAGPGGQAGGGGRPAPPPALSLDTLGHRHGRPRTLAPARPARAPARPPTAPTPAGLPDAARSQAAGPGMCAAGHWGQRGRVWARPHCAPASRQARPEPRFEVTSEEREMCAGRQVTSCWRRGLSARARVGRRLGSSPPGPVLCVH